MLAPIDGARLLTLPTVEPLTLVEAKAHLRVDVTDDDALITGLIIAARQYVEQRCWCALLNQTWIVGLETWPNDAPRLSMLNPVLQLSSSRWAALRLPMTPLLMRPTITAVRYQNRAASPLVLASTVYSIWPTGELALGYGQSWPGDLLPWSIEVEYVVGYGATAASVPAPLLAAVKLMLGHLYENREAVTVGAGVSTMVTPLAVDSLLALYEVRG